MEHLVRFRSAEGREGYHQAPNLEEALKFVERLRNNEGVDSVRLYRLQEVPIEFRPYYRVELRADGAEQPVEAGAVPPVEERPSDDGALVAAPGGSDGEPGNRRLFGRT